MRMMSCMYVSNVCCVYVCNVVNTFQVKFLYIFLYVCMYVSWENTCTCVYCAIVPGYVDGVDGCICAWHLVCGCVCVFGLRKIETNNDHTKGMHISNDSQPASRVTARETLQPVQRKTTPKTSIQINIISKPKQ